MRHSHLTEVSEVKSKCTAIQVLSDETGCPYMINFRPVSLGTFLRVLILNLRPKLYSFHESPSSVLYSTLSVGSSSLTRTRTDPESPNSHRCASLWISCHVVPPSREKNVSESV